jgi:phospholipase/carboxylesterase
MTDHREAYAHHAEGAAGAPLVFAFHGTGGDETQFVPLVRDLLPGAAIVAPRGDVDEHGAARFFRRRAEGVYDMADRATRTATMADFVAAHVAAARPSRVLGLGYSNGANILASVIFARPELFDAAVLMHPLIPWTPPPAPVRTRVLITAGERDPIAPPAGSRALADWFRAQGAEAETVWHPGGHEVGRAEVAGIGRFLQEAAAERATP